MKIAFASNNDNIKTPIDPLFGRCNWFCIYDTDRESYFFIKNPANNNQSNAGMDAAGIIISQEVNIAVAGRFGSKASDLLRRNNIQMVIPQNQITIEDFINQIQNKK